MVVNFFTEYLSDLYKKAVELDLALRVVERRVEDPSRPSGEVLSRVTADLENAVYAIATPLWLFFVVGRVAAVALFAFWLQPLSLPLILPFAALYAVLMKRVGPRLLDARSREREAYGGWFKRLKEAVEGAHSLHRLGLRGAPKLLTNATATYFTQFRRFTLYSRSAFFLMTFAQFKMYIVDSPTFTDFMYPLFSSQKRCHCAAPQVMPNLLVTSLAVV